MKVCPSCGRENRSDARFCSGCATPLQAQTPPREERKVVTVLFCDLVGFTPRAERLDPEDVRAILAPYYQRLRAELERHGGTVEKFIGDAVMAVFGAPIAHEDDPERAVRAAFAIRDAIAKEEGDLRVRIGVTTGGALVALGVDPARGEAMVAGDVVNTAARLQAAAPENGVIADETTYRATRDVIQYREREPVEAKGKAEPIPVWEAVEARSRFGFEVLRRAQTPLVGRQEELDTMADALRRARRDREPQLVTVVGVPGIGKSRLLIELFHMIEPEPDGVRWRQGRCLSYGDGVGFWALAEIVKAESGILETDSGDRAAEKLRRSLPQALEEPEARWIERHLSPLVGLPGGRDSGGDSRGEAFAAWRRYVEALAEERPLVLVFEDIHFGDDELLDFVDYLADWTSGVPLLVVCTARPELLVRRAGWGGGKPNAVTLSIPPLAAEETAQLVRLLLERTVLPANIESSLLERAAGNPLYAEEFVRLALERDGDDELQLPESVQGLIAARLDALPPDQKELLQNGAVVGTVFWLGALAAIGGGERWTLEERLHALERKEFVRRDRRSSVAGESEYAFRHLLVRDAAYGQIPRALRADKHRSAAEWIESLGRPEDHAEMLAHHYLSALQFARASGQDTALLELRAPQPLRRAGDRALALNAFDAAARLYAAALELCDRDDPDRGSLLFGYGKSQALGHAEGEETLAEASEALLGAGDVETAADAELLLSEVWRLRAEGDRGRTHLDAALALVRARPPSPSKVRVLNEASRYHMLTDEVEEALRVGREALAMAEALQLDELRGVALNNLGTTRMVMGDPGGREDLERGIELTIQLSPRECLRAFNNLGAGLLTLGDLREAGAVWDRGREVGRRFGDVAFARFLELNRVNQLYWSGSWEDADRIADDLITRWEAGSRHVIVIWAYDVRARIRVARGKVDEALDDARKSVEVSRRSKQPQLLLSTLSFGAVAALAAGREEEAAALAEEVLALRPGRRPPQRFANLFDLAVALSELGRCDALLDELARAEVRTPWVDAAEEYARRAFVRAADVYAKTGALPLEAFARLRAGEQLLADGRREDAEAELQQALAFYRRVGASAYAREAEELLAGAGLEIPA